MKSSTTRLLCALAAAVTLASCDVNRALEQIAHARQLSADLQVQFTRAAGAANRAVMSEADDAARTFARVADEARAAVKSDAVALEPLLDTLEYRDEAASLRAFTACFAEYDALDRQVLALAVENTNVKARRLSFGPSADAADAFAGTLAAVRPASAANAWQVRARAAAAVAAVREIQALEAPHIAEREDAVMDRFEARMRAAHDEARRALADMAPIVDGASRARMDAAAAELERFMRLNAELLTLSRRNTNVRSVLISMNEKGRLADTCERHLRALRDALHRRGYTSSR